MENLKSLALKDKQCVAGKVWEAGTILSDIKGISEIEVNVLTAHDKIVELSVVREEVGEAPAAEEKIKNK